MIFTAQLPIPPSVNRVRRADFASAALVRKWRIKANNLMLMQKRGELIRFRDPVEIHVLVKSHYHGDLDNIYKTLSDYLVTLTIIPDDSPKYVRRITMEFGEAPEGCVVTVRPLLPIASLDSNHKTGP